MLFHGHMLLVLLFEKVINRKGDKSCVDGMDTVIRLIVGQINRT